MEHAGSTYLTAHKTSKIIGGASDPLMTADAGPDRSAKKEHMTLFRGFLSVFGVCRLSLLATGGEEGHVCNEVCVCVSERVG